MSPLLLAKDLGKRFGGLQAIDGINLSVPKGAIHSVIGPNGAGKTTLFNCLTSFVQPTSGEIWLNGARIDGLRPDRVATLGIARTYQNIRLFPNLTALENIMVGLEVKQPESLLGTLLSTPAHRRTVRAILVRANELLVALGLAGRGDRLARHLPYGDQRRLEIARDEYGLTILLIEHQMRVVMGVSERISVLDHGICIAEGTPAQIRADPTVVAAYLGARAAKHGMDALETGR